MGCVLPESVSGIGYWRKESVLEPRKRQSRERIIGVSPV